MTEDRVWTTRKERTGSVIDISFFFFFKGSRLIYDSNWPRLPTGSFIRVPRFEARRPTLLRLHYENRDIENDQSGVTSNVWDTRPNTFSLILRPKLKRLSCLETPYWVVTRLPIFFPYSSSFTPLSRVGVDTYPYFLPLFNPGHRWCTGSFTLVRCWRTRGGPLGECLCVTSLG